MIVSENSITSSASSNSLDHYGALGDDNALHFACANARSIVNKVDSLITSFEENKLHLMLLTETWLKAKHCPPRVMNDLTVGANLNFIRKDRGGRRRGGGVAICYDPTKIRLTKFEASSCDVESEFICAAGTCTLTQRKIVAIAIYLHPH